MHVASDLQVTLSPGWRRTAILILVLGFAVLIWMTTRAYQDAPPIPQRVVNSAGKTIFTENDILAGQQVFLKYGLMENGTLGGHGAYLGPDFSAQYLHTLVGDTGEFLAKQHYQRSFAALSRTEQSVVEAEVSQLLKQNRYDPVTRTLTFTEPEVDSYQRQQVQWAAYFSQPASMAVYPSSISKIPRNCGS